VEREQVADAGAGEEAGDTVEFYLPFVATPQHVRAMQAYLAEYLQSLQGVTVGQLAVDHLRAELEPDARGGAPALHFRAWMAPFDLGVGHDAVVRIEFRPERGVHQYHLSARLFGGDRHNWRRLLPRFVLAIRKQLLLWRVLGPAEHLRYAERGAQLFGAVE
jgi:hypothetical protein